MATSSTQHHKVIANYKATVPPACATDFIKKWHDYQGATICKAPGFINAALNRPVITNNMFHFYSEWKTMDDLLDFNKSKDTMDFVEWIKCHDIKTEFELLSDKTGLDAHGRAVKAGSSAGSKCFTVLSLIMVKPSKVDEFIKVFQQAAEKVMDENGNEMYQLTKHVHHNDKFYLYGSWTSQEAWKDHLESDHIQKLKQWSNCNDVVHFYSPLDLLYKITPAH